MLIYIVFILAAEMFREDIMKHYETAADLRAKMQKSTLKEQSEIYEQLCMSACSDVQVHRFIDSGLKSILLRLIILI